MTQTHLLIKQFAVSLIALSIIFLWASFTSAYSTWTPPTATAPSNNSDTPLNVSASGQIKSGGLVLNLNGAASSNGLIVYSGKVGINTGAAAPAGNLDVNGSICLTADCITSWTNLISRISLDTTTLGGTPPTGITCYGNNGVTSVTCGDAVYGDDASAKKVCSYAGYDSGYSGLSTGSFSSPTNNYVIKWETSVSQWRRYVASTHPGPNGDDDYNKTISNVTCAKLTIN